MKLAIPTWIGRVSPVFDVARRLALVEVIGGEAVSVEERQLRGPDRVSALLELGVDVLICGAISGDLEEKLLAAGVDVVAEIRGSVEGVINAFLDNGLSRPWFAMPGCYSRRRRARARGLATDEAEIPEERRG